MKFMTMHKALYPRDDKDWLYVKKKDKRGLTHIEDIIDASIQGPKKYTKNSKEKLIAATTTAK